MAERAGQKVQTAQGAMPRDADFKQHLCADIVGFSLHAAVRCGAEDRQALEQLCRCITCPAPANERVQTKAAGQLVLELKTAWPDGPAGRAWPMPRPFARHKESDGLFVSGLSTTHLVRSPLEFMQRLAALVPHPRLHLIRFHGVLAPNAKRQTPEKDNLQRRSQCSTVLRHFQRPLTHGEGRVRCAEREEKAAFEKPIPLGLGLKTEALC